jgi:hypothetical protein
MKKDGTLTTTNRFFEGGKLDPTGPGMMLRET